MKLHHRFLRGDQYAIALALLDEGKVVLGVLACPNLPLASIGTNNKHSSESSNEKVGCLFSAKVGEGTFMHSLDVSSPIKVSRKCLTYFAGHSFKLNKALHIVTYYISGGPVGARQRY